MSLKVVSVVHYYPPHVGGMEVVAQRQAKGIAAMGYDSTVLTCALHKQKGGVSNEDGVKIIRGRALDIFDRRFSFPYPIIGLGLIMSMRKEIKETNLVHLHDVFYQTSWAAYFLSLLYKKPFVLTQHVAIVDHQSKTIILIQKLVYRTIGRSIFNSAKKIITYNHNVKQFLVDGGVDRSKVVEVRNGVDINLFKPVSSQMRETLRIKYGLPLKRPLVLFVGRFVHKKGYLTLLEARSDKYDIVLVGTGMIHESWEKLENVHVLGARPPAEVVELNQLCDVFAFPARGEIFTLAMQEAMASGLPVVTTNDPAYELYGLDGDGIELTEAEPLQFRQALEEIVDSPPTMRRMSLYSRMLAEERFNWDRNIDAVSALYSEVLAGHTHGQ